MKIMEEGIKECSEHTRVDILPRPENLPRDHVLLGIGGGVWWRAPALSRCSVVALYCRTENAVTDWAS